MAFRIMLEIVKLTDCGVATTEHLDVGQRRVCLEVVGIEADQVAIHRLSPRPQRGDAARREPVGVADQTAVVRVRVQIRDARHDIAGELQIGALQDACRRLDNRPVGVHDHVAGGRPAVVEQEVGGLDPGAHATRTPRRMTRSTALWPMR